MAWLAVLGMVLSISGEGTTRIVGSGTVAPLAEIVRQRMDPALEARLTIEPTGSNRGFTLFCGSADPEVAPLTLASRAFGKAEVQACEQSLGAEVSEHIVGLNGLILVTNRRGPLAGADLTRTDLFLAFAKNIPDTNCTVKKNDKQLWSDVRADLPAEPIEMFGPGETSGTFSSFLDLAMVPGA
ncbi:MAG: substrate-binding domain-containing protein, partial [Pseudomonadota bacterium]